MSRSPLEDMAKQQKPYCCRTRIRLFFTLSLIAAVSLFLFNLISQVFDIPPSTNKELLQAEFLDRHQVLSKWRKERGEQRNQPILAPVQCTGKKCDKLMPVLGLDGNGGGGATSQHCKHPLFLPQNDSTAGSFPTITPLKCRVPEEHHCGFKDREIIVAAEWSCLLQAIERPDSKDNTVSYTSPVLLTQSTSVQELGLNKDFYRLSCVPNKHIAAGENKPMENLIAMVNKNEMTEQHFFTHIFSYPEGELETCPSDRCLPYNVLILGDYYSPSDRCLPYNVFIPGVGSLSQASFRRLLPKTYNHFIETMQSVKFDGYNVVGDGTTGALLPLLTGLDESRSPEVRINKEHSHYADKLNLLWNAYDAQGYATLYAEDHPSFNTFNERFQGFERTPTAHYMRPFWLAAESHLSQQFCLGKKPKHQYMLDYLLDFFSAYSKDRRFAVAFLKELTHADVSLAQHLDNDLLQFLRDMSPYLKDTIVVLMTDHGLQTHQSVMNWQTKVQARMPLLSIYLPSSFLHNNSDIAHAMISNEDKLVTPYDIHHTLKDIIDIPRLKQDDPRDVGRFGQSLFKPLPVERTCKSAGVDIHWCACHTYFNISDSEIDKVKVGEMVLMKLNELTSAHRDSCAPYSHITVLTVLRVVPNEEILRYETLNNKRFTSDTLLSQNYYQVTVSVKTSTSDITDIYELTVEPNDSGVLAVFKSSYTLVSEIVRINKPKVQSCPVDKDIIRYCSCVSQSSHELR